MTDVLDTTLSTSASLSRFGFAFASFGSLSGLFILFFSPLLDVLSDLVVLDVLGTRSTLYVLGVLDVLGVLVARCIFDALGALVVLSAFLTLSLEMLDVLGLCVFSTLLAFSMFLAL